MTRRCATGSNVGWQKASKGSKIDPCQGLRRKSVRSTQSNCWPTSDRGQQLLCVLLTDFRRRPWHGSIFEPFDAFCHPTFEPVAHRLVMFSHNLSNHGCDHLQLACQE